MTFERFTDRSRRVFQLAKQSAQRYDFNEVEPIHVLMGLIREGSGVAANVLKNMGVSMLKIEEEAIKLLSPANNVKLPNSDSVHVPISNKTKMICEYSIEEAANLGHNWIGTEHLLLGLCREHEGVAAQVLANVGVKLEDIREEILNLLGVPEKVKGGTTSRKAPMITVGIDPYDAPMTELRHLMEEWSKKHKFDYLNECKYLYAFLQGRLDVQVALAKLKEDKPDV